MEWTKKCNKNEIKILKRSFFPLRDQNDIKLKFKGPKEHLSLKRKFMKRESGYEPTPSEIECNQ